jgi:AbrB family looped-hinge helix DNA binding protein
MRYVVGPKGQVVINKEIRDRLGVEPGWQAVQRLVGDRVEIRFLPPAHTRSLAGCLAPFLRGRSLNEEELHHATEGAWSAAARREEAAREVPES